MTFDSRPETYDHILKVQMYLHAVVQNLMQRALVHDQSKLVSPEVEAFDATTPKLKGTTYGSDEYRSLLREIKPALQHHYENNSHHPEYYKDGIKGMNLLDIVEMICDWKAASLRHADGDILRSIELNQERFGYSDELKNILLNTVRLLNMDNNKKFNIEDFEK